MMKLQDVLLKAMAKKITWWAAAEIIGVTDRTMRRWKERMEAGGYAGLADRRKGKPSAQRIPLATVEEVLRLYRKEYFDPEHPALSREAAGQAQDPFKLHVGAEGLAGGRVGGETAQAGAAPAPAPAPAPAGGAGG